MIGNNIIVHNPTKLRLFSVALKVSLVKPMIFKLTCINSFDTLLTFKTLTQLHICIKRLPICSKKKYVLMTAFHDVLALLRFIYDRDAWFHAEKEGKLKKS